MDNNDSKPQQTGGLKLMTVFIAVLALHVLVIGGFTVYHLMGSGGSDADLTLDKTHKLKADGTVVTDTATPDATAADKTADATATTDTATTTTAASTTTPASTSTSTPEANPATTDTATPSATPAPTAPATTPAPAPAATQVAANTPAAPETKPSTSPIVLSGDDMGQTSTIPADNSLAPPPDAPAPPMVTSTPASSNDVAATAPAPSIVPVEAPAAAVLSSNAPSGPVAPEAGIPSGPVRMPANPPVPAAKTNVASSEEHVSAPSHEERTLASTHETKKQTYTVKITDSYQKIAHAHHITVAELKAANHIKGDVVLHTGQKLVIPMSKTLVAKNGESHDISTASLSASPTTSVKTHRHYYTVTKGDTLKYVAKKFNVTPSAIEDANNLSGTKLAVGEKLRIPSHTARAAVEESTPSASLTDRVAAPVAAPVDVQPSQVVTQPAPVEQPAPAPMATPEPAPAPQPTPASSPELTSLNF